MEIVGIDQAEWPEDHVHTIDIWYSKRRRCWIIERLNAQGEPVGAAHRCETLDDIDACVAYWLRAHDEVHLVAARALAAAVDRGSLTGPTEPAHARQRRAA